MFHKQRKTYTSSEKQVAKIRCDANYPDLPLPNSEKKPTLSFTA